MKKALVLVCAALMLLSISGCRRYDLTVWSFTDELGHMISGRADGGITMYFSQQFPDISINYSMTPTEQFPARLDGVLQAGRGAPDVFALESAFVRRYVESGLLLDLTEVWERNRDRLLPYTVEVGMHDGRVYALSWQATPGAVFYRRSLAQRYLGTDDPEVVQQYFADFNAFLNTARLLSERSGGSCVIVSSLGDLQFPFFSAREQPWVVDGRLVIDPVMDQYLDIARTLFDNRWEGRVGQWSEGWFAGMNGALRDEAGNPVDVFAYFLPTWGLHYVLAQNAPDTAGDWAMIEGPIGWRWGGTWLGAWRNTPNPEAAKHMIEWLTTNDEFLEQYARDTGDFVSNMYVVNRIKDDFSMPFLGGQNHYAMFAEAALNVDGRLTQRYDDIIQAQFVEVVNAYVNGEMTREQAMSNFRQQVSSLLGIN